MCIFTRPNAKVDGTINYVLCLTLNICLIYDKPTLTSQIDICDAVINNLSQCNKAQKLILLVKSLF